MADTPDSPRPGPTPHPADRVRDAAENARDPQGARGGAPAVPEPSVSPQTEPAVAHADRLREESNERTEAGQERLVEAQRRAAEDLARNAERLKRTAAELDRTRADVSENAQRMQGIRQDARELADQTEEARDAVRDLPVDREWEQG